MTPPASRLLAATPQFTVPDLVATCAHYRDALGFRVVGYWDGERATIEPPEAPVFAIVARDDVQVFFNRADGSPPRTGRALGAYDLFVRVSGVDALAADLRARGAGIVDGPQDRPYGERELVVRDCNGLVLAFGERLAGI
jgi:catechol 2,3-dioxygenase-like lactoylglutathione lyase family enzyme